MKPKNKFQARIVDASKTLPKLTKTQIQWGYNNVIQYVGRRTDKGVITCLLSKAFDNKHYPKKNIIKTITYYNIYLLDYH